MVWLLLIAQGKDLGNLTTAAAEHYLFQLVEEHFLWEPRLEQIEQLRKASVTGTGGMLSSLNIKTI